MLVPLMKATFMRRLTPATPLETTRKHLGPLLAAPLVLLAGCATPGPLHIYTIPPRAPVEAIYDRGTTTAAEVPSFLKADDTLLGFAYDPFTDHFFLRLAPGNKIRVVDRPARAVKREFEVPGLPAGGDLAIRPRDGHVFFLEEKSARITETSRLGKPVRTFALERLSAPAAIAYDTAQDQLLILHPDHRTVSRYDTNGKHLATLTLEATVGASLAFDSERQEIYAPHATSGVPPPVMRFDARGKLLQGGVAPDALFLDVGPRSFVRVF